jgi:hypothetical protein
MTKPAYRFLYAEPRPDSRTPYWTMRTIWAAAEGKPVVTVAIENLNILDAVVRFGGPKNVEPTIRTVVERAHDVFSADLGYPIIMTRSGDVLDGAHRIAKAYLQGERTISAVVIDDYPPMGWWRRRKADVGGRSMVTKLEPIQPTGCEFPNSKWPS